MVATLGTTMFSALTTKMGRIMKMLANTFANDDYCISAATSFLAITLAIIIDTLNYR